MFGIHFFGNAATHLRLAVLGLAFLAVFNCENLALGQKTEPSSQLQRKLEEQSQEQPSDVVRVRTDLVQTSVAVFDKRGKFVNNLGAEDFELRVDGNPHPVLFFDRVVDGLAEGLSKNNSRVANIMAPEDKTRTVLFFVDDLHLSSESMNRARKMLSNYIDEVMGENDEVVIASASGQVGFLQQLTREKEVLRAAVERLKYRPQGLLDIDRPTMSPYQALSIQRGDADVLRYFSMVLLTGELSALARRQPQLARDIAERRTQTRADRIVRQVNFIATQTLTALNNAVRSSSQISGRKLVVFISDGFFINNQTSDITNRLQHIADAAVRTGAVMYTVQASGLNTTFPDASSDVALISGVGGGRVFGEDTAAQDPLTQLASDTGGKALLNANDLSGSLKSALRESNDYYLLAWRPDKIVSDAQQFHRIEVSVKGHPDLSVLVQRGFFKDDQTAAIVPAKVEKPNSANTAEFQVDDLAAAIKGRLTGQPLQTSVMVNYLDVPNHGPRLSLLMQVDRASAQSNNGKPVMVDVAGVIYDESGKVVASFTDSLRPEHSQGQHFAYLNQFDVKPGLYQVRGAARDSSGSTGMAMQWIKVPDLGTRSLALSSLLIGERELGHSDAPAEATPSQKAQLKIDRRFIQQSRLRFVTFIYNATRDAGQVSRLNARVDIFRGNKPVFSTPAAVIETKDAPDPARIPYAGELSLASLPRGNYVLRVTVIDLVAKAYANQETSFVIQ